MPDKIEKQKRHKLPRLYVADALAAGGAITLAKAQSHYLANVLRLGAGDGLRLFNGKDGEWLARIDSATKAAVQVSLEEELRPQGESGPRVVLLFAPLKKQRMPFLIEKAVELGCTDFVPIKTQNTELRGYQEEKCHAYMTEAAEQCERLDMPVLHPLVPLKQAVAAWQGEATLLGCVERAEAPAMAEALASPGDSGFVIGPEGGWTEEEKAYLCETTTPVSLGERILRAETAALFCLSAIAVCRKKP